VSTTLIGNARLVDEEREFDRDTAVPIITHCEFAPTIDANIALFKAQLGDGIQ
jgi:hypothetical protein